MYSDPSQVIRARIGQTFVIALDANRTTSFSWQLATGPNGNVQWLGAAYQTTRSTQLGAGGQELWMFRAVGAGDTSLTLRYVRPFDESSQQNAKSETFRVEIAPSP